MATSLAVLAIASPDGWSRPAALAGGSHAARPSSWARPTRLSARDGNSSYPLVAFDRKGDAIVVWDQERGSSSRYLVMVAERAKGRRWTRPTRVSPPEADSEEAGLAVAPSGAAVVVWQNSSPNAKRASFIEATSRAGWTARWRRPVRISPAGAEADFPAVGIDAHGDATAIWVTSRGRENLLQTATVTTARGRWSAPTTISSSRSSLLWPQLAVDGRGDAVAAWLCCSRGSVLRTGVSHVVLAAFRPGAGASWGRHARLGSEYELPGQGLMSFEFPGPHLAIDAHGGALLAWQRKQHAKVIPVAAFKPPGGHWGRAQPISSTTGLEPHVGLDARGDATAVWQGADKSVLAATRPARGHRWSRPHKLARAYAAFDRYAHVVVNGRGVAIATWSGDGVQAAVRRRALGAWGGSARLGSDLFSEAALDPFGAGMVVWEQPVEHPTAMVIIADAWK